MNKKHKGFTLAEMLIVVAIVGILISIAANAVLNALEKARETTELANIRSACELVSTAIIDGSAEVVSFNGSTTKMDYSVGKVTKYKNYYFSNVKIVQKKEKWESKTGAPVINNIKLYFETAQGRPFDKEKYWVIQYNETTDKWSIYHTNHTSSD